MRYFPHELFLNSILEGEKIGIVQPKNGPCGLLAAVNAVLISQCLVNKVEGFGLNFTITDQILASALGAILQQTRPSGQSFVRVARWKGKKSNVPTILLFQFRCRWGSN